MPNSQIVLNSSNTSSPNYNGLIKFLIEPLLESPDLLFFDCEQIKTTKRVWIRLAFEEDDRGRIYGRGGRNIQAVRTLLQTAADAAGDTLYLEIYGDEEKSKALSNQTKIDSSKDFVPKEKPQRPTRSPVRPSVKPRFE